MLQTEALEILKTGSNVFLTGIPGAGKTYVINEYVKWLRDKGIYPAITASTGIAATHINGRTIHSFVGIGVVDYLNEYVIDKILERESLYKKLLKTQVLIIDEISMLDASVLDKVDTILKAVKKNNNAFGGIQIIFVGDFFQLPPVTRMGEVKKYAFQSAAWREAKPLICYLEEQYRQTDEVFSKLLMAIRENNIDEMHIEILEELKHKTHKRLGIKEELQQKEDEFQEPTVELEEELDVVDENGEVVEEKKFVPKVFREVKLDYDILELHTHNRDVDQINEEKLARLKSKEFKFLMDKEGSKNMVEGLIKSCLSPEVLRLKVGAKVIFTKNAHDGSYVNGTMGRVIDLESFYINVRTNEGKIINVKEAEWKVEEGGKVRAKITQYPLRLAWAITVHKSQGMSLDEALLNLGETFEYGQGYVALSRLRSLEGLFLTSYNDKALRVNDAITEYDEKIRKDSKFIQEKFKKATPERIEELQKTFVEKCEGEWEGGVEDPDKIPKKNTYDTTCELVKFGKKFEEIVTERKMTAGTIFGHIEELYKDKKLTKLEISKIAPVNIYSIPNAVKKAFKKFDYKKDEQGNIKLFPVYEFLEEKYNYDDLRWYRLFNE